MLRINSRQFLGLEPEFSELDRAAAVLLLAPYEGGVSYGRGTNLAPDAVIEASEYLELYDEDLNAEPFRMGIATAALAELPEDPTRLQEVLYENTAALADQGKLPVVLGGDHSISTASFRAVQERHSEASVIQIDAHSDLRDTYEGSRWSHACVMSRIRELTPNTLQIGIRSMSAEEAVRVKEEQLSLCTMSAYRNGTFDIEAALEKLPDPVYLTLDVDALDWSVVRSTGTPEPGGFTWSEITDLLQRIFRARDVVGLDVVELSYDEADRNSPFAVAKLIYKMLGFKLESELVRNSLEWPRKPRGGFK